MAMGSWWARRWEAAMQELGIGSEGTGATRSAYRVKRLEVIPGGISASVQDKESGSCAIEVRLATLSNEQWERVAEVLSGQPIVATNLLSGAVPPEIEQVFTEAGARLLPASTSEFVCQCSCCSPKPCRHLPHIFSLFAEMLSDDASLLLVLRGRDRQQLLRAAGDARATHSAGAANGSVNAAAGGAADGAAGEGSAAETAAGAVLPQPAPADSDPGLAAELDQYWGNRKLIKQFHHHIAPPTVELSLLRRLGPINGSDDAMALYEQMVSLYRRITDEALALAYAADGEAPPPGNGSQARPAANGALPAEG